MLIFISGTFEVPSGFKAPARRRQKVVFPVPFSPIMTTILKINLLAHALCLSEKSSCRRTRSR